MAEAITSHAQNRCAVVTGGNKGIGFEICKQLASQGILVVLTARDVKKGNEAFEKLKDSGLSENVVFHQLDVVEPASIASLVDFIESHFGKLDILVNNAGAAGLMVEGDVSIIKEIIMADDLKVAGQEVPEIKADAKLIQTYDLAEGSLQTNYYGVKQMIEAFIPLLQLSSSPRIVNVSSLMGRLELLSHQWAIEVLSDGESLTEERVDKVVTEFLKDFKDGTAEAKCWPATFTAYKVSKAAINAYTRILAKKYPTICINCVCPGYCKTDITCNTGFSTAAEGAEGSVKLALLPDGGPSGLFFSRKEVTTY
ncbi:(+)-neomenthol dehydrogenase-like [Coffea eugenioides]|uniref:(+)-neomenthol dehydrogenase-like n=1 Tax=Coffea eugenioides TaxID=49369 RepID=UPI000F613DE3|nr:(+)-neomenthol dehydrogenase-like [Coffea eugenioides]XP_027159378.1 (+)-neomenthol dehydrogenase-like [Coffea eugenioides]